MYGSGVPTYVPVPGEAWSRSMWPVPEKPLAPQGLRLLIRMSPVFALPWPFVVIEPVKSRAAASKVLDLSGPPPGESRKFSEHALAELGQRRGTGVGRDDTREFEQAPL